MFTGTGTKRRGMNTGTVVINDAKPNWQSDTAPARTQIFITNRDFKKQLPYKFI
jgi:hypothetical protein